MVLMANWIAATASSSTRCAFRATSPMPIWIAHAMRIARSPSARKAEHEQWHHLRENEQA